MLKKIFGLWAVAKAVDQWQYTNEYPAKDLSVLDIKYFKDDIYLICGAKEQRYATSDGHISIEDNLGEVKKYYPFIQQLYMSPTA